MLARPKHTVATNGRHGIPKLRRHQDCRLSLTHWKTLCVLLSLYSRYVVSVLLKKTVLFKCSLPVLRLTPLLALLSLPILLARLISYHNRERPPRSVFTPRTAAVILSTFPITWFFGFLYYTDIPSLAFVVATIVAACEGRHVVAGIVRIPFCELWVI